MQPPNANLQPLPQDEEEGMALETNNSSIGELLPIEEYFSHLCNLQDAELVFQAAKDPVVADPLRAEFERLLKEAQEASKIHEQKILQLKSDRQKEVEKLVEKYRMLAKNAKAKAELEREELKTNYEIVLKSSRLAEASKRNHDKLIEGEEVTVPSSLSAYGSRHKAIRMPDLRLEQCKEGSPLHTPKEAVNTSTTIPETGPVRACNNPMIQAHRNLQDGCNDSPAPPLGASTAGSSYKMPLRPHRR